MASLERSQEPAVVDAVAHVVSTAGRVLEDRITLARLELRRDAQRMLRTGVLRVATAGAGLAALGLGVAAVITALTRVMSVGWALGIPAIAFAIAAAGLWLGARRASRRVAAASSEPTPSVEARREPEPLTAGAGNRPALTERPSAAGSGVTP